MYDRNANTWDTREARAYAYPAQPATTYTREFHSAGSTAVFHVRWALVTLASGGLAAPVWWWATRKRNRPTTYTSAR